MLTVTYEPYVSHIIMPGVMLPLIKFWSSADHCGHLIPVPKGILLHGTNICRCMYVCI